MTISARVKQQMESASWIRKMFEEGEELKRKVGAAAVFDFSLGNPIAEPPAKFHEVMAKLLQEAPSGSHRYMPNAGFPEVRAAIAAWLSERSQRPFLPERIVMACGAGGGLNITLKALLDPGDEVVIFAPYFVEYLFYVDNHGGKVRVAETTDRFDLDVNDLEKVLSPRTKAVIINSPNNPTGRLYPAEALARLGESLRRASEKGKEPIYLISDEPYRQILFDGLVAPDVFDAYSHTILVTSHSKDLSIPGERIGFVAVGPDCADAAELAGAMTFANRILGFVNAPALMQRASARLQGVTVDPGVYQRKRDLIAPALKEMGYEVAQPEGAFYVFPKSPIDDDVRFTHLLLEENILVVPGAGFGRPGHFRISFCVPDEVITSSLPGFLKALESTR
ncbi:MAG: pyridoxal phosphate-dependent aminotransferase [Planctomycetota bacterium]|nr:pyridoxal phosphate-dependent aminotransferase [Planctomycetota bacterium]